MNKFIDIESLDLGSLPAKQREALKTIAKGVNSLVELVEHADRVVKIAREELPRMTAPAANRIKAAIDDLDSYAEKVAAKNGW